MPELSLHYYYFKVLLELLYDKNCRTNPGIPHPEAIPAGTIAKADACLVVFKKIASPAVMSHGHEDDHDRGF